MMIEYKVLRPDNFNELYFEDFQNADKFETYMCPTLDKIKYFSSDFINLPDYRIFYAKDVCNIVGILKVGYYTHWGNYWAICYVSVLDEYKKQGIAKSLFDSMANEMKNIVPLNELRATGFTKDGHKYLRGLLDRYGIAYEDKVKF